LDGSSNKLTCRIQLSVTIDANNVCDAQELLDIIILFMRASFHPTLLSAAAHQATQPLTWLLLVMLFVFATKCEQDTPSQQTMSNPQAPPKSGSTIDK
jgi:hypothetical protein